jgi:hypothetical protein
MLMCSQMMDRKVHRVCITEMHFVVSHLITQTTILQWLVSHLSEFPHPSLGARLFAFLFLHLSTFATDISYR